MDDKRQPSTTNIQGWDNSSTPVQSDPTKVIHFDAHEVDPTHGEIATGNLVNENSDLTRLQAEDLRSRALENTSMLTSITADYVKIDNVPECFENDSVLRPDSRIGRIQLCIRYLSKNNALFVQILDAQGLIRPEQAFSLEMIANFSLIGRNQTEEEPEKHQRVIVENGPVSWKEPIYFHIDFDVATKQNLYVLVKNDTDPAAPKDREVSIPLSKLAGEAGEINQWFELQDVQSAY